MQVAGVLPHRWPCRPCWGGPQSPISGRHPAIWQKAPPLPSPSPPQPRGCSCHLATCCGACPFRRRRRREKQHFFPFPLPGVACRGCLVLGGGEVTSSSFGGWAGCAPAPNGCSLPSAFLRVVLVSLGEAGLCQGRRDDARGRACHIGSLVRRHSIATGVVEVGVVGFLAHSRRSAPRDVLVGFPTGLRWRLCGAAVWAGPSGGQSRP